MMKNCLLWLSPVTSPWWFHCIRLSRSGNKDVRTCAGSPVPFLLRGLSYGILPSSSDICARRPLADINHIA